MRGNEWGASRGAACGARPCVVLPLRWGTPSGSAAAAAPPLPQRSCPFGWEAVGHGLTCGCHSRFLHPVPTNPCTLARPPRRGAASTQTRKVDKKTEYLIRWSDGADDTWEPVENVSEDVRREFEGKWWDACREGDEDAIVLMLAEENRDVRKTDKDQRTGLHYVCGRGKSRAVSTIINYGARINAKDADGYTPLHIAAGYQYVETVAQLMEAGADPDLEDSNGRTPLQLVQSLREMQPKDVSMVSAPVYRACMVVDDER